MYRITERSKDTEELVSVLHECESFQEATDAELEANKPAIDDGLYVRLEKLDPVTDEWEYL